jgi:general secretion pathway protein I
MPSAGDANWNDDGFTLIEALVAMAVLALGAVSLLAATEGHTARITAITDRTTARWVAENRLTEVRLGLPPASGQEDMLGQSWQVATTLTPTTEPALQRVTVTVGRVVDDGATLVTLNGYAQIAGAP